MGLRGNNNPFPEIPTNVQPSDVPSGIPGEEERQQELPLAPQGPDDNFVSQQGDVLGVEQAGAQEDVLGITGGTPVEDSEFAGVDELPEEAFPGRQPRPERQDIVDAVNEQVDRFKLASSNAVDSDLAPSPQNPRPPEEQDKSENLEFQKAFFDVKAEMSETERRMAENTPEESESIEDLEQEAEQALLDLRGETFADPTAGAPSLIENWMLRGVGSLGISQQESIRHLMQAKGHDNVEFKNGNLWYRDRKGQPFFRLDPEGTDLMGDVVADNWDAIVETAGALPVELGLLAGATALTATGAGAPAGVALGLSAPAAGASAGVALRRLAFPDEAQDQDAKLGSELMYSVGMSYVAPFALKKAFGGLKFTTRKLNDILNSKPITRAKDLAKAVVDLENGSRIVGVPGQISSTKGLAPTARRAYGELDRYQEELGSAVGAVKDEAIELAGDDRFFDAGFGLGKMKQILKDSKMFFNKNGEAVFFDPAATDADFIEFGEDGLIAIKDEAQNIVRKLTQEQFSKEFGVAKKGGSRILSGIVNKYNSLVRKANLDGGLTASSLQDVVDIYSDMAFRDADRFGNVLTDTESLLARKIRNGFAESRNGAFNEIFEGANSPSSKTWRNTFNEFAERSDDWKQVKKMFSKSENAGEFAEKLFKSTKGLQNFKKLVGPLSDEWKNVRNEWLSNTFKAAKDPKTGVFLPEKWTNSFKKIADNEELFSEIMTKSEHKMVKNLVKNVADIPFDDLMTKPKSRNIIKDFIRIFVVDEAFATTRADIFWGWFGKNVNLTEDMFEGLMEEAQKAGTKSGRDKILKLSNKLKFFVSNSKPVTYAARHPTTKKLKKITAFVPKGTDESSFIGRRGEEARLAPAVRLPGQKVEETLRGRSGGVSRRSFKEVAREEEQPVSDLDVVPAAFRDRRGGGEEEQIDRREQFRQQFR